MVLTSIKPNEELVSVTHPTLVVVSYLWPLTVIVGAAAIDLAFGYARRNGLPAPATRRVVIASAVIGLIVTLLLDPLYLIAGVVSLIRDGAALLALAALLLGALGAWGGSWLGLEVGATLRRAER